MKKQENKLPEPDVFISKNGNICAVGVTAGLVRIEGSNDLFYIAHEVIGVLDFLFILNRN